MKDYIILLAGHSGAGKTTLAEHLCQKYGMQSVSSYTDREKRSDDEQGHVFLTPEEFDQIDPRSMVAYTEFVGHRYCATSQQVDNADIYVIDKKGIREFRSRYKGKKAPIVVLLQVNARELRRRMLARGDSFRDVEDRIEHDNVAFKDIGELVDITVLASSASVEEIADNLMQCIEVDMRRKKLFDELPERASYSGSVKYVINC